MYRFTYERKGFEGWTFTQYMRGCETDGDAAEAYLGWQKSLEKKYGPGTLIFGPLERIEVREEVVVLDAKKLCPHL